MTNTQDVRFVLAAPIVQILEEAAEKVIQQMKMRLNELQVELDSYKPNPLPTVDCLRILRELVNHPIIFQNDDDAKSALGFMNERLIEDLRDPEKTALDLSNYFDAEFNMNLCQMVLSAVEKARVESFPSQPSKGEGVCWPLYYAARHWKDDRCILVKEDEPMQEVVSAEPTVQWHMLLKKLPWFQELTPRLSKAILGTPKLTLRTGACETLGQLLQVRELDLLSTVDLGRRSLNELKASLSGQGYVMGSVSKEEYDVYMERRQEQLSE